MYNNKQELEDPNIVHTFAYVIVKTFPQFQ